MIEQAHIQPGPWLAHMRPGDTLEDVRFSVPVDPEKLEKARGGAEVPGAGKALCWIEGIASTEGTDLQNESVLQRGIDTRYFLKHGYFNNDHKPGFKNKVGEPTEAKLTKTADGLALWVKGFLYKDSPIAQEIEGLIRAQQATPGSSRRVGFSIQGKVLRRDGKKIVKCWLQDVAVTPSPINPETWVDIAKSFDSEAWLTEAPPCTGCGWCSKAHTDNQRAAAIPAPSRDTTDEEVEAGKALAAAGLPLVPESLEGTRKDTFSPRREEKTEKSLTRDRAIEVVQLRKGYSFDVAALLVDVAFQMHGQQAPRAT